MYRVVIVTLSGLFVVLLLASAPEFKAENRAVAVEPLREPAAALTSRQSSDHLRRAAFRTVGAQTQP